MRTNSKQGTYGLFSMLAVALLLVAGCGTPTGQVIKEETIKIGWIGPLSGPSTVLGMDSVTAAEIAVAELNAKGGIDGKKVELLVEDDQYDVTKSMSAYQKLVNIDGAKILLVHTYGAVFALAEQARQDGVLLMDPLDCNSVLAGLGENIACLATDSESIGEILAEQAVKSDAKRVGIIYSQRDIFMPLVKDVTVKGLEQKGISVEVEGFAPETRDFRTMIMKMQDTDALVLLGHDETGLAMKQARDIGYTGTFLTTGTVTSPPLQEAAEGAAEGTVFAFWDAPQDGAAAEFKERFVAEKGRAPILDLASYPTYDAVNAIAKAIEAGGSDAKTIAEALPGVRFEGVTGTVAFDRHGASTIPESAHILENGAPVAIA